MTRISHIEIDDSALPPPGPELEQERRVAVFDLMERNAFAVPDFPGPYRLRLGVAGKRLAFDVEAAEGADRTGGTEAAEFQVSLAPFRQVVKDYGTICQSYFDAVKTLPPGKIEAIDQARRKIHDEGARILAERLEGKAELDADTARRLFTLICVLHPVD